MQPADPPPLRLSDFDFDLPEGLIATRPARPRSAARLLVAQGDRITDATVADLPGFLRPGDLLVLNDTKVIPARLTGTRTRPTPQGDAVARIEVTLTEPTPEGGWKALVKPLRKLRPGEVIRFGDHLSARVTAIAEGEATLAFDATGAAFEAALAEVGAMPLPPYIAALRVPDAQDRTDYQTVWARAADAPLLAQLARDGVEFVHVTLHVGAGTFLPVKTDDVSQHRMHAERGLVTPEAAAAITRARTEGRRVIAVGTTALRLIESAADADGTIRPFDGATDIFIRPGYRFRVTDGLMTNFHLPKSTLLMLVSALMGQDRIRAIYAHAIAARYRFFSYGDASLLLPEASC